MKPAKVYVIIASIIYSAGFSPVPAAERAPDLKEIVRKLDELYRSKSSYSELEMQITTPHWQRTLVMKAWSEGMKKTFIRILSPAKDKGIATLRIGNEMWNYLPNVNKVIKIPPSMMAGSWMGSDFTNDDLVKESTMIDDYDYRLVTPEGADPWLVYVEFVPKPDKPIVWAKIVTAVRRQDYLAVQEKYYDEKGGLMRVLNFTDVKQFNGRSIPTVMEMLPQKDPGHITVIRYRDIQFDIPLGKDTFTLRNLHSRE